MLSKSKTPAEGWLKILSQCTAQVRNKTIVERIAQECDLTLSGFRSDATLELYFDIARGRQDLGYIAKGREDPGFRIGDLIQVPQSKAFTLIANAFQAMKICATNGIGISVQETADRIELQLDGVIYSEGFNRDTFVKTLDTLNECVLRSGPLLGSHDPEGSCAVKAQTPCESSDCPTSAASADSCQPRGPGVNTSQVAGEICRGTKECAAAQVKAVTTRETQVVVRSKPRTIAIPLCAACAKAWDDHDEGVTYWS